MNYFLWLLRILVLVLLLGFVLKNLDPVTVRYYLGSEWEAPLAFVLLIVFVLGTAVGVLASFGLLFRTRREVVGLRKQLRAVSSEESR